MGAINVNLGNKNIENYLSAANDELKDISQDRAIAEFDNNADGLRRRITGLEVSAETIGLNYNLNTNQCELYSKVGNSVSTECFDIDEDEYDEVCKEYGVDIDAPYNHSGSRENEAGDLLRVFASTKPIAPHPCVTINIARKPLGDIQQKEVLPLIEKIFTNNFIIVGATGSGKTYFLNNALQRTFKDKPNRIFLIEEFHELFRPNAHTCCLNIPPIRPGEIPIFDHVIAQTNLMRCQNIFVGEIKGREAFPFVMNLASGTKGGCTMHGSSSEDGLMRLQMLMATAGIADRETCGRLISKSINYVIFMENHRITDIQHLTGTYNSQTNKWQMENIM